MDACKLAPLSLVVVVPGGYAAGNRGAEAMLKAYDAALCQSQGSVTLQQGL